MAHNETHLGWLKYTTETESNTLIQEINTCLGFPTADGKTLTWSEPSCLQNDYEGSQTESGWFVIIKDECYDCLSQEQKDNMITELPYYIACGTPMPNPSGDTENYL
jgi:hypothetical protein